MSESIKILIVDDHALFRRGVVELLREQPDFTLVGEAGSGAEALRLEQQLKPDVMLLDLHMPGGSGVEVIQALKHNLALRILMLTVSDKDEDLKAAIDAGADGYLLKSAEPEELCYAIRQVAAGQSVLSPQVTAKVMQAAAQSWGHQQAVNLSRRECEVLAELEVGS